MKRLPLKSWLEKDAYNGKRIYCYVINNNRLVRWVKKKYRKKERAYLNEQMKKEISGE